MGQPLQVAWSTDVGGYADHTPVVLDGVAVAAVEARLLGIDVASGAVRWELPVGGDVIALAGAAPVAVATVSLGEEVKLVAVDASGEVAWERADGWQTGRSDLRGTPERVLALGVAAGAGARQACRVLDAASGEVVAEVEVDARRPPYLAGERLVWGVAGEGARAGLFETTLDGARTRRLHPTTCALLTVAGDVALFADQEHGARELVAVDLGTGAELWRTTAGPSSTLPADGGEVAATVMPGKGLLAPVLLDVSGGQARWEAEPVEGSMAVLTLTGDLVLMQVDVVRLLVHDRVTGELVQSLERISALADGLLVSGHGVIDSRAGLVECLRG